VRVGLPSPTSIHTWSPSWSSSRIRAVVSIHAPSSPSTPWHGQVRGLEYTGLHRARATVRRCLGKIMLQQGCWAGLLGRPLRTKAGYGAPLE